MRFARDLVDQADHLARLDARKPRQANLRRAVSSAYYALFHLLVQAATAAVGTPAFRPMLARVPRHEDIKRACKLALTPVGWQGTLRDAAGGTPVPAALTTVCEAFIELQDARHEADYNLAAPLTRRTARAAVQSAAGALDAWDAIKTERSAQLFLLLVLFGERWRR